MPAWLKSSISAHLMHDIFVLQIGQHQPDDISQSHEKAARNNKINQGFFLA